jgi:hypothetical protein
LTSCEGRALAALIIVSLAGGPPVGCSRKGGVTTTAVFEAERTSVTLAEDVGVDCADVDEVRACWDAAGHPALIPRTLPSRASLTPLGYRCTGQGDARTCASRDDVGPFVCAGEVCTQRHPRQPDDGQWQCSDDSGVTVCTGGEQAAGIPPGSVEPGWVCGNRRPRAGSPPGARVCIDLSPDFPGGSPRKQLCRWRYETAPVRECRRGTDVPSLGDICDATAPCVSGASCAGGRCLPPRPVADCVLDSDCERGACRFGSCTRSAP